VSFGHPGAQICVDSSTKKGAHQLLAVLYLMLLQNVEPWSWVVLQSMSQSHAIDIELEVNTNYKYGGHKYNTEDSAQFTVVDALILHLAGDNSLAQYCLFIIGWHRVPSHL